MQRRKKASIDMERLLHTLESTGTPHGITTLLQYVYGCPRRAWLDKQYPEEDSVGRLTGTIGHAYMEHYFKGTGADEDVAIQFSQVAAEDTQAIAEHEAERCFRYYTDLYSRDEFGQILAVEEAFSLSRDNAMGLYPYTGRWDLAVRINAATAQNLQLTRGIDIEPGVWLVDHKFLKSFGAATADEYAHSVQFAAYATAWDITHPNERCEGVIANIIVKSKQPQVRTVISRVDLALLNVLEEVVYRASQRGWPIDNEQEPECNPMRCWDYFKPCPHWIQGNCKRY